MNKIAIKKGFITQKMGENLVIFDGEESILYTLNATAAFIFNKLKKGLTEAEIAAILEQKYSITSATAKKDTSEIVKDFKKAKIID